MARPITWQNVNIDNGSSAAAFGNTAANFAQGAVQGADVVNDMIKARMERDDTLLTNEAISQALSGGPKVSPNRRVNAEALQLAVERQALGQRQQEGHQDDLLTSAVNRRLNTANAAVREKDFATYDDRFELDKQIAQSEADYRATQSEVARANLEELRRQRAEMEKDREAFAAINQELFGPQVQQKAIAEHEAYWAQNAPEGATPQDKALDQQQWLENAQQEVFNNPRVIHELALKYGTTPLKVYQGTAVGQRALEAQKAADAIYAERAALTKDTEQTFVKNAQLYGAGNDAYVRYDPDKKDYVFEKDTPHTSATFEAAFADARVDPKDPLREGFRAKIEQTFKSSSVAEQLIKDLVRDGKIPQDYAKVIDDLAVQLRQRAKDTQNVTELQGSSDRRVNSQNFYRSIEQRLAKNTNATEAAAAIQENPIVSGASIASIPVNPKTEKERDEARDTLKVAVDGLLKARTEVKIPADASQQLRELYQQFQYQVDVANGGLFLPNQPADVAVAGGPSLRVVTPKFPDRKKHAVDATATLQRLQLMLEREKNQKEADRLRLSLD